MHDEQRSAKGARNQALWRHVNERIASVMESAQDPEFICECASLDCTETLQLTIAEYEAVRESPRRFPIAPGHERPEFERIVEQNGRYTIVEKVGRAGELAEKLDAREAG